MYEIFFPDFFPVLAKKGPFIAKLKYTWELCIAKFEGKYITKNIPELSEKI